MVVGFPRFHSCPDLCDCYALGMADADPALSSHFLCKGNGHCVSNLHHLKYFGNPASCGVVLFWLLILIAGIINSFFRIIAAAPAACSLRSVRDNPDYNHYSILVFWFNFIPEKLIFLVQWFFHPEIYFTKRILMLNMVPALLFPSFPVKKVQEFG